MEKMKDKRICQYGSASLGCYCCELMSELMALISRGFSASSASALCCLISPANSGSLFPRHRQQVFTFPKNTRTGREVSIIRLVAGTEIGSYNDTDDDPPSSPPFLFCVNALDLGGSVIFGDGSIVPQRMPQIREEFVHIQVGRKKTTTCGTGRQTHGSSIQAVTFSRLKYLGRRF